MKYQTRRFLQTLFIIGLLFQISDIFALAMEKHTESVSVYSGTVAGIPVKVFLQRDGNELRGFYFYKWARPLILKGKISDDNNIFLDEYDGAEVKNAFEGRYEQNTFRGRYAGTESFQFSEISKFQGATVVRSQEAKKALLGEHLFSLQWISWDYYGNLTVFQIKDQIFMYGRQENERGEYVSIEGKLEEINEKSFTFSGKLEAWIRYLNGGDTTSFREGKMSFGIADGRKYWRLRESYNAYEGTTDYVDIYFKRPVNRYSSEGLYILE